MKKIGVGILAMLIKVGPKILSILGKLGKTAKIGKVGLAASSVIVYSYIFTWQFAIVIMVGIFIHEYGHVWAMRKCNMKVKGIYFIPFLGAAAVSDSHFPSRKAESYVALMGPIWGLGSALVTLIIYLATNNPLFGAIAGWLALVNLFNLLPISPLDGGRVFKSIALSINNRLGIVMMFGCIILSIILAFKIQFGLFGFLAIVGILDLLGEYGAKKKAKKTQAILLETEFNIKDIDDQYERAANDTNKTGKNAFKNSCEIKLVMHRKAELKKILEQQQIEFKKVEYYLKDKMSVKNMVYSVTAFIFLVVVLWFIMKGVGDIEEVKLAMELLT